MADEQKPEGPPAAPPPDGEAATPPVKPAAPAAKPAPPKPAAAAHAAPPKPPATMAATPWDSDLAKEIKEHFGDRIVETSTYLGQNFVVVKPDAAVPLIEYLKLEADFDYLVDVTAVDWPSVLELASANAREAGVAERFRVVPGNAFEIDWGAGFDLVILANFLHHFSPVECATILRKVKSSLSPTGRACAVDFVPNEDRVSPPMQAMFAFSMLATTPGGDAWTQSELDEIAKAAGFRGATARPLRPTPQSLIMFET